MDYLSLCLICKDENEYLPEWLDYHILMGVDRFYIYDNESRVSLRESLKEYIARGWVVVVDIPGIVMQLYAYDHCLQTFGSHTFWIGFIDADEFLVPKTTLDLKELLKDYEPYGGLAVSELFFGSNGHKTRPSAGQIAAYTRHTHATLKQNLYVKSIVQPGLVLMPNTPHDFTYIDHAWCVNEGNLRVDFQCFPNYTTKIQLNHYYCRSEEEIDLKLARGNSQIVAWPRKRFEVINSMATYKDTTILQNLKVLFQKASLDICELVESPLTAGLLEKMSVLAHARQPAPLITGQMIPPHAALSFRAGFLEMDALKAQTRAAINRKEFDEFKRLMLLLLQRMPQNIVLYTDIAAFLLDFGDHEAAWQMLSQAWLLSPNNNYNVLSGMAFYFIRVENYTMAENICRLLLGLAPHELTALGLLTYSLLGQRRYEEALRVGVPVVELSAKVGELPERMGVILVKKMADYLLEKKDYTGAARLWEAGVKCQRDDVNALLEFARVLLLAGDKNKARQRLTEAQALAEAEGLAAQNEAVQALLRQVVASVPLSTAHMGKKRSH